MGVKAVGDSLKIFYDGACYLCSAEIDHYRKFNLERLCFINIADPHFDPQSEGLDPVQVKLEMHVKDSQGTLFTGVDAFTEIWKRIPRYQRLVPLVESRFSKPCLRLGYFIFARMVRPYLPKKKVLCDTEACPFHKR